MDNINDSSNVCCKILLDGMYDRQGTFWILKSIGKSVGLEKYHILAD